MRFSIDSIHQLAGIIESPNFDSWTADLQENPLNYSTSLPITQNPLVKIESPKLPEPPPAQKPPFIPKINDFNKDSPAYPLSASGFNQFKSKPSRFSFLQEKAQTGPIKRADPEEMKEVVKNYSRESGNFTFQLSESEKPSEGRKRGSSQEPLVKKLGSGQFNKEMSPSKVLNNEIKQPSKLIEEHKVNILKPELYYAKNPKDESANSPVKIISKLNTSDLSQGMRNPDDSLQRSKNRKFEPFTEESQRKTVGSPKLLISVPSVNNINMNAKIDLSNVEKLQINIDSGRMSENSASSSFTNPNLPSPPSKRTPGPALVTSDNQVKKNFQGNLPDAKKADEFDKPLNPGFVGSNKVIQGPSIENFNQSKPFMNNPSPLPTSQAEKIPKPVSNELKPAPNPLLPKQMPPSLIPNVPSPNVPVKTLPNQLSKVPSNDSNHMNQVPPEIKPNPSNQTIPEIPRILHIEPFLKFPNPDDKNTKIEPSSNSFALDQRMSPPKEEIDPFGLLSSFDKSSFKDSNLFQSVILNNSDSPSKLPSNSMIQSTFMQPPSLLKKRKTNQEPPLLITPVIEEKKVLKGNPTAIKELEDDGELPVEPVKVLPMQLKEVKTPVLNPVTDNRVSSNSPRMAVLPSLSSSKMDFQEPNNQKPLLQRPPNAFDKIRNPFDSSNNSISSDSSSSSRSSTGQRNPLTAGLVGKNHSTVRHPGLYESLSDPNIVMKKSLGPELPPLGPPVFNVFEQTENFNAKLQPLGGLPFPPYSNKEPPLKPGPPLIPQMTPPMLFGSEPGYSLLLPKGLNEVKKDSSIESTGKSNESVSPIIPTQNNLKPTEFSPFLPRPPVLPNIPNDPVVAKIPNLPNPPNLANNPNLGKFPVPQPTSNQLSSSFLATPLKVPVLNQGPKIEVKESQIKNSSSSDLDDFSSSNSSQVADLQKKPVSDKLLEENIVFPVVSGSAMEEKNQSQNVLKGLPPYPQMTEKSSQNPQPMILSPQKTALPWQTGLPPMTSPSMIPTLIPSLGFPPNPLPAGSIPQVADPTSAIPKQVNPTFPNQGIPPFSISANKEPLPMPVLKPGIPPFPKTTQGPQPTAPETREQPPIAAGFQYLGQIPGRGPNQPPDIFKVNPNPGLEGSQVKLEEGYKKIKIKQSELESKNRPQNELASKLPPFPSPTQNQLKPFDKKQDSSDSYSYDSSSSEYDDYEIIYNSSSDSQVSQNIPKAAAVSSKPENPRLPVNPKIPAAPLYQSNFRIPPINPNIPSSKLETSQLEQVKPSNVPFPPFLVAANKPVEKSSKPEVFNLPSNQSQSKEVQQKPDEKEKTCEHCYGEEGFNPLVKLDCECLACNEHLLISYQTKCCHYCKRTLTKRELELISSCYGNDPI